MNTVFVFFFSVLVFCLEQCSWALSPSLEKHAPKAYRLEKSLKKGLFVGVGNTIPLAPYILVGSHHDPWGVSMAFSFPKKVFSQGLDQSYWILEGALRIQWRQHWNMANGFISFYAGPLLFSHMIQGRGGHIQLRNGSSHGHYYFPAGRSFSLNLGGHMGLEVTHLEPLVIGLEVFFTHWALLSKTLAVGFNILLPLGWEI